MKAFQIPSPVLYGLITLAAGVVGFYYTEFYSGWGHSSHAAVPVAFGLSTSVLFGTAIVVSEISEKTGRTFLYGSTLFWLIAAAFVILSAP